MIDRSNFKIIHSTEVLTSFIEKNSEMNNFDIAAASGGAYTTHTETVIVTISDGQLKIDFYGVYLVALLSAISVIPQ